MVPLLLAFLFLLFVGLRECIPPPSPVQCISGGAAPANGLSCSISNSYGVWPDRSVCQAANVVYPTTEAELLSVVADAVRKKQKMKVVTKWSHSIPKWACPGGEAGLLISTELYNTVVAVDTSASTVTVQSGVPLRAMIDKIAESGLALAQSPYWEGVTIGGLISTGSHGSSFFGKGSAVHEYISGLKLVVPASSAEGYAKVISITATENEELMNAAKVSLGVLGVISEITLMLEPMFKRSVRNVVQNDDVLEQQIIPFAMAHEFADVTWHPSQNSVLYRDDDRVPTSAGGDGVNDYLGFRPQSPLVLRSVRGVEELCEKVRSSKGKCAAAKLQIAATLAVGTGFKNNNLLFLGYPVVGYQNRIQTAGSCLLASNNDVCAWDPRVNGEFFYESTFSIPVNNTPAFIADIKKLRDLSPDSFCGTDLYAGFLFRFVKASSAYLGEIEDVVEVNFNYYRSRDPSKARLNEDVWEEVEQMALFKYGGRPAWAKNRNLAFENVWKRYPRMSQFLDVKQRVDPDGLFSSDWSDSVFGLRAWGEQPRAKGCALDGGCVCSTDDDCAPDQGYVCRPGKVYLNARVCTWESSS